MLDIRRGLLHKSLSSLETYLHQHARHYNASDALYLKGYCLYKLGNKEAALSAWTKHEAVRGESPWLRRRDGFVTMGDRRTMWDPLPAVRRCVFIISDNTKLHPNSIIVGTICVYSVAPLTSDKKMANFVEHIAVRFFYKWLDQKLRI